MIHHTTLGLAALTSLVLTATKPPAQTTWTSLFPQHDKADAPSVDFLAGLMGDARQQFVIAASLMKPLERRVLKRMDFRRDAIHSDPRPAVQLSATVSISPARRPWNKVSPLFALNAAKYPTTVLQGTIQAPASPKPGKNHVPWAAQNTIPIPFAKPYRHLPGPCCVTIDAREKNGGVFWSIDGLWDDAGHGSVASIGKDCGDYHTVDGEKIFCNAYRLRVGASTHVSGFGPPGASSIVLLGMTTFARPVDLGFMGAPGCKLHLHPWIQFPVTYRTLPYWKNHAYAGFQYDVPADNAFRGATAYVQFADNLTALPKSRWKNPAGITLSNALQLTVASRPSSLGIAVINGYADGPKKPFPTRGYIDLGGAPIIRFAHAAK